MHKSRHQRCLDAVLILLCCLLSVLLCVEAYADDRDRTISQFQHTAWTAKVGAPGGIEALAQSRDGYLWLGTNNGLYRFDGLSFERIDSVTGPAFPSRDVCSFLALPNGDLWMGFRAGGISLLRAGVNTNYGASEGVPQGRVRSLAQDGEGTIWAGTDGGLARFEQGRWKRVEDDWNYPGKAALGIDLDRQGTLWVATESTIVFLPARARRFQTTGVQVGQVPQFADSSVGKVWMAETTRSVRPVPDHRPSSTDPEIRVGSNAILFDHEGSLWITTLGDGLRRVPFPERLKSQKIGEFSHVVESFTAQDGLSGDYMEAILEDREGNIWVGTANGLDRFRKSALTPLMLSGKFQTNQLVAGNGGDILISGPSDSFGRVHGGKFKIEQMPIGSCIGYRDRAGIIWWVGLAESDVFTEHQHFQVLTFRSEGGRLSRAATSLRLARPYALPWVLAEDRSGRPLLGTQEGLFALKDGRWRRYEMPPELAKLSVLTAFTDSSGTAWFGYNEGTIAALDEANVRTFSADQGLHVGSVRAIEGHDGHLWAGGEHGLALLDGGKFRAVAPADSEEFSGVSGIVETPDGGLWLSEYRGAIHIPAAEVGMVLRNPSYRVRYQVLESLDGLPGAIQETPQYPSLIEGTDGRLWFATTSGVAWIDPVHAPRNLVPPPVSIRWVNANGKRYAALAALKLPALTRSLQIGYTALSFSIPERVHFRYKLAGIDDDWQDADTRREAFYSGLRPGKYQFRIIACNNDGVWNEAGAFLDFSIAPAYYQTTWFRATCFAAFLAFLWGIYQLRVQHLQRQFAIGLEARVNERTRIARDLHDTLLQSLHGLMFEFQAVRNMFHGRPEEALEALDGAIMGTERAITESQVAIEGLRDAKVAENDLAQLLRATGEELLESRSADHDAPTFGLTVEGERRTLVPTIQDEVYRIAREVLRNAFRHAHARRIEAEILYDEHQFRLRVRDDGKGMDPQVLEKGGLAGHWGLPGVRERAQQMGAKLDIWGEAGTGTEVQLTVAAAIAYEKTPDRSGFRLFRRARNHDHRS